MARGDYRFTLVLSKDGEVLDRQPATIAAAVEDRIFRAVLRGEVANDGDEPEVVVEPLWHDDGAPRVGAIKIGVVGAEPREYSTTLFAQPANLRAKTLLAAGKLANDSTVNWSVEAERRPARTPLAGVRVARITRKPFPLVPGHLEAGEPGSFSVTVTEALLESLDDEVTASPDREFAGLLVGRIVHDASLGVAEVRAERYVPLPAGDGGTSGAHFDFGPATFLRAKQALAASAPDETCTGWAHSHPPCAGCKDNPECKVQTVFFSNDDVRVHGSSFGPAYQVGLVAGKLAERAAGEPGCMVFGWHDGCVAGLEFALATTTASAQPKRLFAWLAASARERVVEAPTLALPKPQALAAGDIELAVTEEQNEGAKVDAQ